MNTSKSVSKIYNYLAKIYNFLYGITLQDGRVKLAQAISKQSNNKKILELGVGSGLTLNLYPSDSEVVGVDVSSKMLELAEKRVKIYNLKNVKLILSDAEDSNLEDGSFDHVVLAYIYSVTPDPDALLEEAFRICRNGGRIWILNHFSGMSGWRVIENFIQPFSRFIGFRAIFPFDEFITKKNLKIISIQKVNIFGVSRLIEISA